MPADSRLAKSQSWLRCRGCGHEVAPGTPFPFRCPNAGSDNIDHVLRRQLVAEGVDDAAGVFSRQDENPFVRYRELLHSYQQARAAGMSDHEWREMVETLDRAVAGVDQRSFRVTSFAPVPDLAANLGVGQVWIKDESENVSGSHKGRHLMGIMLWLESAIRCGLISDELPSLAIASCGNAALAAAVVARAARQPLKVFVPTHADSSVLERLAELGAHLQTCPRQAGEAGDPCYLRFRKELADGAVPFTCQGNENGMTLDGGKTLAWEMVSSLREAGSTLDRLFLHVGGGALATSVIEGLRESHNLGVLARMPKVHAVQTTGAYPLVRAYGLLSRRILERWARETGGSIPPGDTARARALSQPEVARFVADGLEYAATHRSEFMWPWEEEPRSVAEGILDDETYDWLAVVEGMLETGGWPVVVSEEALEEANRLVRSATGGTPCHTGTAGVAGALACRGELDPGERVGFLVTGIDRSAS